MVRSKKQREYDNAWMKTPRGKFSKYKSGAKVRGHEFSLDFELFNSLLNQNCHYCGRIKSNGVDRKDNLI